MKPRLNPHTIRQHLSRVRVARRHGLPWPPNALDLSDYVAFMARKGYAAATVSGHVRAIRAGLRGELPGVPAGPEISMSTVAVAQSHARRQAARGRGQAPPISPAALAKACEMASARDRAVFCLAFAAALRPGELAGLRWSDVTRVSGGLELWVRSPKTGAPDLAHAPASGGPLCPVAALEAWREESGGGGGGWVFPAARGGKLDYRHVGEWLRARAREAGDPTPYTGHSLRRGAATAAYAAGSDLYAVSLMLRHKTIETTARYIDPAGPIESHPMAAVLGRLESES